MKLNINTLNQAIMETNNDNFKRPPRPDQKPNSNRVQACSGKQYGDRCSWKDATGKINDGFCIYNKWGLGAGELFCAERDYRETDPDENS